MINLHVHDKKGSLLDSILDVKQIVQFAKKNNQEAIAITNHGTMFSYVDFYKECIEQNIKPILGCEVYEVDDMTLKNDKKDNKQTRYHLILLAKNQQGLKNLYKIISDSYTIGFYTKPRIDINYINKNNLGKGIVCLTACQAGRLSRYLVNNYDEDIIIDYLSKLENTFDNVYLEIQSHDTISEINANTKILNIAKKYNKKYVVTSDAHMLTPEQQDVHSIFVQIGEGREVGETYTDCYLQTDEDVHKKLDKYHGYDIVQKAIEQTHKIADEIELIDIGLNNKNQMPKTKIPKQFKNNIEYFRYLVYKDFDKKFNYLNNEEKLKRKQRIEEEISILVSLEYIDYFIMLYELMNKAIEKGIPLGLGRGSACGCLCAYMMNITQVDSVKWDLDFSRFANLGRKSMADIDLDISRRRRKEIIEIAKELFGKDNVVPMCTFNTLSTKVAIRDIGKVLHEKGIYDLPYQLRDEVSKLIPTIKTISDLGEEEEKDVLLRDVLFKNEKLKEYNEKYPLWFKYVLELEGSPKSLGRHASGTLITPKPIYEYMPLCLDSEGNAMTQLEMHNSMDDLKLIKMDFLGLNSLDIIDDTLKLANKDWDFVNVDKLNLDDKNVFNEIYKTGNTTNIFQMESAEAVRMCIEAQVDNIEDIIAINAFNRPGTKNGFSIYVKNKQNPNDIYVVHPDLLKIFAKTHFVLLYQEQALQLFRYAGFPEEMVDNARRCVDENTNILMADGNTKKIKDIKVGDYVISFNKNGYSESKEVSNVYDNGYNYIYEIETQYDYNIKATGEHKIYTQDGWKKVKELNIQDYVFVPKKINTLYYKTIPIKIKSITKSKEKRHVYDIEVNDNHNYIANNILVHNCISKKEKNVMKTLKSQFIYGDKEQNIIGLINKGWTKDQANEIWTLMEKQADYSFNRSHSVAYGLTSYIMSYLKYYYPVEFMTACMNANISNTSKLSILINECNRLGIKVKPPHINKSNKEFTPIVKNKEILFGFSAIKSVKDRAIDEILKLRPFKNLDDFLERGCKVLDKTTVIALCKSGAIPTKNKMNTLLKYAESMINVSEYKEIKSLPTLLELQTKWDIDINLYKTKEERLKVYNEKRKLLYQQEQNNKINGKLQEFKDKYLQDESMWEFETLSMFLTNNPFDRAYKEIEGFHKAQNDTRCVCLCVVIDIKRKKDKNGNVFAYLDLYTLYGIIESICWSKQYSKYQDLLKKGNAIAILGRKREDKLFVEKIKSFNQWKIDKNMKD